jgi:hypothetical protein
LPAGVDVVTFTGVQVVAAKGAEILHAGHRVPQERMIGTAWWGAFSRHLAAIVDAVADAESRAELLGRWR